MWGRRDIHGGGDLAKCRGRWRVAGNACSVEIVPEVVVLADFDFGVGFVCDDGMGIERSGQGEEVFVGSDDI